MYTFDIRPLSDNWFFRYRIYHIPFWCLYTFVWWCVAVANPMKAFNSILFTPLSIKFISDVAFSAVGVYFNLYVLMPLFFEKRRLGVYSVSLLATILFTALGIVSGYYISAFVSNRSLAELYGSESNCFYYFLGYALPSAFASTTLAMTIKLTRNWIRAERRQQQIEKEKLETELKFLKQQFNPHFLFNSINSIFFLIHNNPDAASSSLATFSELLRHQLYECNDHRISLAKEIGHLHNYLALEKLRQNPSLAVTTRATDKFADHLAIAPFILMTFVENAFKHVSRHDDKPNWIRITLDIEEGNLHFHVANSVSPVSVSDQGYSGIGLRNVRRRLDLLYPGKNMLDLRETPEYFEVKLTLRLDEMVSVSMMKIA